jgi:protein tyrosine phosphatase (PTP) superfamily phosphohydrolase (DUF442 family)
MKTLLSLVSLVLLITALVAAQQDSTPIRNFLRVNEQFCTGGQPRLEHLEQLKKEGVKAIINLRQPSEHRAAEEEAKAKELGLRYFNIPVVFADPKEEQVTEFLKITDDPENRPAFIHCTAAIRVGAFWLIRRVLRDGWTFADAEKEAEKVGLRESPHLNEFARKYIEKYRQQGGQPAQPKGAATPSQSNSAAQASAQLPSQPLKFGVFTARFEPTGTLTVEGDRWPKINGNWKNTGADFELSVGGLANAPGGCDGAGKYRATTDGQHVSIALIADECKVRQMMLDGSQWIPTGESVAKPARNFVRTPTRGRRRRVRKQRREAGRRFVAQTLRVLRKTKTSPTRGTPKPAKTFSGAHRFPGWPTRARSFGAIAFT